MTRIKSNSLVRVGIIFTILVMLFQFQGTSVFDEVCGKSLFMWMVVAWRAVAGTAVDYSHGFIVPFVSLFLIWNKRKALMEAEKRADIRGLIVTIIALCVHWIGLRTQLAQLSVISLILLLWAIPYYVFGGNVGRLIFFPCCYLFFCLPLNFIEELSFPLRLFGAAVSVTLLNGLGIEAIRSGTAIFSSAGGGLSLDVADACSGIKSLMALTSLSAAYAYLTQNRNLNKWLLFASAIPFAVLGNVFRIVTIALVATVFGQQMAMRFYHDVSGYIVFVIVVLLLVALGAFLKKWDISPVPKTRPEADSTRINAAENKPFIIVMIILASAWTLFRFTTTIHLSNELGVRTELPDRVNGMVASKMYFCQNEQCQRSWNESDIKSAGVCPACGGSLSELSLSEKQQLPPDTTIIQRQYHGGNGKRAQVAIVFSGFSRSSIHRPQWCLQAQGLAVLHSEVGHVNRSGSERPLDVMVLETGQANQANAGQKTEQHGLFAYWFVSKYAETPYDLVRILYAARDRLLRGQAERWGYVSVMFESNELAVNQRKDLMAFISVLNREITTHQ